ncbi:MAG: hypothetical protein Q9203_000384 [Teloschistes exilis]
MLAHSTTSSLLTPLLFLVVVHGLTPPASADHSVNSDRHDVREWRVEESPEKAKLKQMPVAVRKMMGQEAEMFFQEYWQFEQDDRHFTPDHEPSSSGSAAHEPDHWTNSCFRLPTPLGPRAPAAITQSNFPMPGQHQRLHEYRSTK